LFFFKKNEKKHYELFLLHHAMSPYSELHINNLLYLLWHSKLRAKMYPISVFAMHCCWSVHFWQACTQQTEKNHSHTKSAVSRHVYVHVLLVQHLQRVYFQHSVWSKIFRCRDGRQIGQKYTDFCRAEEDNQ